MERPGGRAKVTSMGTVTVVPLGVNVLVGKPGGPGNIDGPVTRARMRNPEGIGYMRNNSGGDVTVIADTGNNTIRKLQNGMLTTVAGMPGVAGTVDGVGGAARFARPTFVAADENGKKVWILDSDNGCVRRSTSTPERSPRSPVSAEPPAIRTAPTTPAPRP